MNKYKGHSVGKLINYAITGFMLIVLVMVILPKHWLGLQINSSRAETIHEWAVHHKGDIVEDAINKALEDDKITNKEYNAIFSIKESFDLDRTDI